jgi:hypothetical protein
MQRFLSRRSFTLGLTAICTHLAYGWKLGIAAAEGKLPGAPTPPIAPAAPKAVDKFGAIRIDPYDWLRDRQDPRVVSYLNAENAYTDLILKPIRPLLDGLVAELLARATVRDASVPTTCNGYFYQRRFVRGAQYPTVVRWKDIPESSEEELVLDVGALAAGHRGQYNLGSWTVSSDNRRASPLPLISMVMANFAFLYARFQRATRMIRASKALRPVLCSGPIAKAYCMFAMTQ